MNNLLFRNVICKGYLQKKETKHVYTSTIDDEYIEDDVSITLNQGGSCEQEIYEFVSGEQFIHTELKEPIQVVKVFYGNNKSKIVPIDKVGTWQSPF